MAGKAMISLSTGLEDLEKATVAFLVAVGAAESGRPTLIFRAKEAVQLWECIGDDRVTTFSYHRAKNWRGSDVRFCVSPFLGRVGERGCERGSAVTGRPFHRPLTYVSWPAVLQLATLLASYSPNYFAPRMIAQVARKTTAVPSLAGRHPFVKGSGACTPGTGMRAPLLARSCRGWMVCDG
jgi:hypothetical protein